MKILFFSPSPPWPPTSGGNQRTDLILRALQTLGTVDLVLVGSPVPATREHETGSHPGLVGWIDAPKPHYQMMPWRPMARYSRRLALRLAHNLGRHKVMYTPDPEQCRALRKLVQLADYDLIVGRYLPPSMRAGLAQMPRVIVDVDDLDSEVYRSIVDSPDTPPAKRWFFRLRHIRAIDRLTRRLIAGLDAAWVSNSRDAEFLSLPNLRVLHNVPYVALNGWPVVRPALPESRTLLTVASMGYSPNKKGVDWFLETCWPRIRASEPDCRYRIVGSRMSSSQRDRWSAFPGVEPVGFVEDLEREYVEAAFTVAPVHEGGGTKIKVLESLAYGRTCVVTAHSHRGLVENLESGQALLAAPDEAFALACIDMLRNPTERDRLALTGNRIVRARYSPEGFIKVVQETVGQVVGPGRLPQ